MAHRHHHGGHHKQGGKQTPHGHHHKSTGTHYEGHASQVTEGGVHGDAYTGGSSETAKEARSTKNDFKKGGKVHGKKGKHHHGKHHKFARGGRSPFSSAHVKTNGDA